MNAYSNTLRAHTHSDGTLQHVGLQSAKTAFPEIADDMVAVEYSYDFLSLDERIRYAVRSRDGQKLVEGHAMERGLPITWKRVYTDEELTAKPKRFVGYCNTDAL